MRSDRHKSRSASLATTASALVALVAIAATMNSLPGASVRAALLETRAPLSDATRVRAVAAAVAAAARELVGTERITAALPAEHFAASLVEPLTSFAMGIAGDTIIHPRLIAEHWLDLPPPGR